METRRDVVGMTVYFIGLLLIVGGAVLATTVVIVSGNWKLIPLLVVVWTCVVLYVWMEL